MLTEMLRLLEIVSHLPSKPFAAGASTLAVAGDGETDRAIAVIASSSTSRSFGA
jgi:hypothetical protein